MALLKSGAVSGAHRPFRAAPPSPVSHPPADSAGGGGARHPSVQWPAVTTDGGQCRRCVSTSVRGRRHRNRILPQTPIYTDRRGQRSQNKPADCPPTLPTGATYPRGHGRWRLTLVLLNPSKNGRPRALSRAAVRCQLLLAGRSSHEEECSRESAACGTSGTPRSRKSRLRRGSTS